MASAGGEQSRQTLRFVLDGDIVEVNNPDPTRTVLQFLREDLHRTGTKEGCAEGDCGACTVVVAEPDATGRRLRARAVNACIRFLPTLDGKELLTVESLAAGQLHPAQQAMIDCHGSQCGFCTPGIVMSLFALYKNTNEPVRRDIDHALAGNLCRCTGYRPIIDAAMQMYEVEPTGDSWTTLPAGGEPNADEQERIERLLSLRDGRALAIEHDGKRFLAPQSIRELARALERDPGATLLAGGTDAGLWVTKQHRDLETIIYTGAVAELCDVTVAEEHIDIGAAASLSDAMPLICEHFPELEEMFLRFASPPIRNAGTLGGNVANGSPIGDSMPALIVLGTVLVLRRGDEVRTMPLEDFYPGYQQTALGPGEFVERILIPLRDGDEKLACYKLSKRFDQDISAVCGAYRIRLDGGTVTDARIAYGGMAEIPKRAAGAEQALLGSDWDEKSVATACAALADDYKPITDMRASAGYRAVACENLLRRFWLETSGALTSRVYDNGR
jgi:xanthine dehydrogenase small subunit